MAEEIGRDSFKLKYASLAEAKTMSGLRHGKESGSDGGGVAVVV